MEGNVKKIILLLMLVSNSAWALTSTPTPTKTPTRTPTPTPTFTPTQTPVIILTNGSYNQSDTVVAIPSPKATYIPASSSGPATWYAKGIYGVRTSADMSKEAVTIIGKSGNKVTLYRNGKSWQIHPDRYGNALAFQTRLFHTWTPTNTPTVTPTPTPD
jgi:hypothetical protein